MNIEIKTLCEGTKVANFFDIALVVTSQSFYVLVNNHTEGEGDCSEYDISGEEYCNLYKIFKEYRDKK